MIFPRCAICHKDLDSPGGTLTSPPVAEDSNIRQTFDICVGCWNTNFKSENWAEKFTNDLVDLLIDLKAKEAPADAAV